MIDMKLLLLSLIFTPCFLSGQGTDFGYSEVIHQYEKFMASFENFSTSRDEVCRELMEEYDEIKVTLDNFLAARTEMCKNQIIHTDCASIKSELPDATDGVYRIKPRDGKPSFLVYCDMTEQGGGWLVIQRRQDGSENFYRTWFNYMDGFGNLTGEFWLGNEKIHRLTNQGLYELRIDFEAAKKKTRFAEYSYFRLANMSDFYNLTISGYSGDAGDFLAYHNNSRFSTWNLDLDTNSGNCAKVCHGAWWFKTCLHSNLNGLYTGSGTNGVYWAGVSNIKKTTMKIRPV